MLRSRPPAADYYNFRKKAPGFVLDAFLTERFEVTGSWLTSAEAEVVCLKSWMLEIIPILRKIKSKCDHREI